MRVLFQVHIPGEPRMAGIQQHIRVACHLARNGVCVTLYICTGQFRSRRALLDFFGLEDCPLLDIVFFPHPFAASRFGPLLSLWGMLFHCYLLARLLLTRERERYDLFFTRGRWFPFSHALVKKWLDMKIVLELHEIFHLNQVPEDRILDFRKAFDLERFTYRRADGVVFISGQLKALAERKWGAAAASRVIPSGAIPIDCRPPAPGGPLRRIYYVGNYYWFSGIDVLIRAMPDLPGATLTIVGGGGPENPDFRRVRRLIRTLGLEGRVRMPGFVPPSRLPGIYEEADILALPSIRSIRTRYFISPLKLFEYMSVHRPIVASDLPTIREILRHGENALLVRPEDPGHLAAAIRQLMDDPDLARRLAEQAFHDLKRFTMPQKTRMLKGFFQEILRTGGGDAASDGDACRWYYGPN